MHRRVGLLPEIRFEQADEVFAPPLWQAPRILKNPAPRLFELPPRRVPLHAINRIDDSSGATDLHFIRQRDAVFIFDVARDVTHLRVIIYGSVFQAISERRTGHGR